MRTLRSTERKLTQSDYQSHAWNALARVILVPLSGIPAAKDHVLFSVSRPLTSFPFSALPYNGGPLFRAYALSTLPSLTTFAASLKLGAK